MRNIIVSPDALGQRIAIIGPSSSGKSTLADKLGKMLDCPVYHLDQYAHYPNSHWQRVPDEEMQLKHDAIILGENWVMEGNYSFCMKQRFERAQIVIWLDMNLLGCIARYLHRCMKKEPSRIGGLEAAKHEFSWSLIKYTLWNYPRNRKKYQQLINQNSHLKVFHVKSVRQLNNFISIHPPPLREGVASRSEGG